jgi:hypothetical protein
MAACGPFHFYLRQALVELHHLNYAEYETSFPCSERYSRR